MARSILVFLSLALLLGSSPAPGRVPDTLPTITGAEMPLYPGIAWNAKLVGSVKIQVSVDRGRVAAAKILSSPTPYLGVPSLANVRTWHFSPWPQAASFVVNYNYEIKGSPTDAPESPRVRLDLPYSVTVIARPFRATRFDDPAGRPH